MNLKDIDNWMDPVILKRGREYRINGHIVSLEEMDDGEYHAEVEGSELYTVKIRIDSNGEVEYWECNCPYDMGEVCKHQAAVFLELRAGLAAAKSKRKTTEKVNLSDQLAALNKEQLIDLLLGYAHDYGEVKQRLILHFTKPDGKQEMKQLVKLIRTYIKKNSERSGFVSYRNVPHAVTGAEMAMEKAWESQQAGDAVRAVTISFCVLHEMEELLQSCDDSGGYVGGIIHQCLNVVRDTVSEKDPISSKNRRELFLILLNEAQYTGFEGWEEWQLSILESAVHLVDGVNARQEWEQCVAILEERKVNHSGFHTYYGENIALMRYRLIQLYEGATNAADFLQANMEYSSFRRLAITGAMEQERYDDALRIIEEGELQDTRKGFPGLVDQWKKLRYEVYGLTNQLEHQCRLAEEFAVNGEHSYYLLLKELITPEVWPDVYERILAQLEEGGHGWRSSSLYTRLLVEENETNRLLEYVRRHRYLIMEYYPHLIADFPETVYELFEKYIEQSAADSSNRKEYQKVCKIIGEMKKAGGVQRAKDTVVRLRERYPNRPAFLDELQKIRLS
jgi:hypothetical protein